MHRRPRRNRKNATIREWNKETRLTPQQLIAPLFLLPEKNKTEPIHSMPGSSRLGLQNTLQEIEEHLKLGIQSFVLFPVIPDEKKDAFASYGVSDANFYYHYIHSIKTAFPEAVLMSDVALDPYSSDGHDGLVKEGKILNDETLPILAQMAVMQAQAGIDVIGPSDMMDGRVGAIRAALDHNHFTDTSIMSYAAKYASAFYGPFRDALDSAPKAGDKKTYQMDPCNRREALLEAELDFEEGADILMVKPALAYLDVIADLKQNFDIPISAYNVSGECAMLHAAAQNGWLDLKNAAMEMLQSIHRAGADVILTYFAKEYAKWVK